MTSLNTMGSDSATQDPVDSLVPPITPLFHFYTIITFWKLSLSWNLTKYFKLCIPPCESQWTSGILQMPLYIRDKFIFTMFVFKETKNAKGRTCLQSQNTLGISYQGHSEASCKHCVHIWEQVTIAHWTYTVHIKWCIWRLCSCVMSFFAPISSPSRWSIDDYLK